MKDLRVRCEAVVFVGLVVLLLASAASVQQLVPVGEPFQVNTTIAGDQRFSQASLTKSGFLVVWDSGDDPASVLGQFFDDLGNPIGAEIPISQNNGVDQRHPAVDEVPGAGFLVAWENRGTSWSIDGRIVGPDGTLQGDGFTISEPTSYRQEYQKPEVAGNPNGGFVVVWSGYERVMGRALTSDGQPAGDAFQVAFSGSYNYGPDIWIGGFDHHDRFVIAHGFDDDGAYYGLGVTRVTASGGVLQQRFWEAGTPRSALRFDLTGGLL